MGFDGKRTLTTLTMFFALPDDPPLPDNPTQASTLVTAKGPLLPKSSV